MDFIDVVKRLAKDNNIEIDYNPNQINNAVDFMEVVKELRELEHEEIFGEQLLKKYEHKHEYLYEKGFTDEVIEHFDLGYCFDINDDLYNRITIPWRNSKGQLVGIVGRDVTDEDDKKYKAKYGSKKSKHLYNLDKAKWHDELIIVEDEKSVWRLYQFGYDNAIALGNCQLDNRKWLLRTYVDHVILCLDNDEAGKEARNEIIQNIHFLFDIDVITLPDDYKDVAEIEEKEIFDKCYENRIEVYE